MALRAVFFDKDGTLVKDIPYNVDPELIQLTQDAGPALRLLREMDYRLFVVSNQSGVAKGIFDESALTPVHAKLTQLLREHNVELDGFYYCPHHPQGVRSHYAVDCDCRKPKPGMLLRAARQHGIDLQSSWMVGDILHDVEAGKRAGCRTVLIDNGNETEWEVAPERIPDVIAPNLYDAAVAISRT
jgi:D,D-heptose 1,7-bisphosphate phosphatase